MNGYTREQLDALPVATSSKRGSRELSYVESFRRRSAR